MNDDEERFLLRAEDLYHEESDEFRKRYLPKCECNNCGRTSNDPWEVGMPCCEKLKSGGWCGGQMSEWPIEKESR